MRTVVPARNATEAVNSIAVRRIVTAMRQVLSWQIVAPAVILSISMLRQETGQDLLHPFRLPRCLGRFSRSYALPILLSRFGSRLVYYPSITRRLPPIPALLPLLCKTYRSLPDNLHERNASHDPKTLAHGSLSVDCSSVRLRARACEGQTGNACPGETQGAHAAERAASIRCPAMNGLTRRRPAAPGERRSIPMAVQPALCRCSGRS